MTHDYFSDRELGRPPLTRDELTAEAWGGIVALIDRLMGTGALAYGFPEMCEDGGAVCGTDGRSLGLAIKGEIPGLGWPLGEREPPSTHVACDLVEFCFQYVGKPIQGHFHPHGRHHHLTFDVAAGQDDYREKANRIFARNGLALELQANGEVRRLGPPVLREALAEPSFQSGDAELDRLLETARTKFLSTDKAVRGESLEKLWDAWERLKTLGPGDKKASVVALLDTAAPAAKFRGVLENDALELTRIGNEFMIRHTETNKVPIDSSLHIDYLFHRLFALIWLLLQSRGRP